MKTFEARLREESVHWVTSDLLTADQRSALLARHPEPTGGGRFVAILGLVGGGLLLAGICLLIGANWEEIGDWVKIGGLVALLLGAYVAGWRFKIAPGRFPKMGDACFMLGAGLFMAGIALVSQIYHLNARPASGVFVWWLGIVAVPWLVRSRGSQAVSLTAFLIWLGMEFGERDGWFSLMTSGHEVAAGVRLVALLSAVGLAVWLSGLALRGTRHDDFADLHETGGAVILCMGLYGLGFLRHFGSWHTGLECAPVRPLALVAGLVVLAGWGAWRISRRDLLSMLGAWALAVVPLGLVLAGWNLDDDGWLWSACAWTALFVLNVFMIRTGLASGREGWVNLGLGFVALNIVTRYFDLFGTLLEGGIFFVVSGGIVLTLGIYLERKRRSWLAAMRTEKEVA